MEKSIVRASYKVDFALLKKEIKALELHKNNAGRSLIEYFSHISMNLFMVNKNYLKQYVTIFQIMLSDIRENLRGYIEAPGSNPVPTTLGIKIL